MNKVKEKGVYIPIEWHYPEGFTSRYANNIIVQHTKNEFILSFFETLPPILLGSLEEIEATLEEIESIHAECVARIIISEKKMPEFMKTIQDNMEKYLDNNTVDNLE